ncbi:MAG: helix-turn-helix domain-containing protein [Candidatus Moranbacteria bacterium]|nr:helix-turn-helix domain-containing protein [Candidatus Moranbacteria bacterium]
MAAANFTRKRVGSLTLGEKLRKVRDENRISLSEVSRATGIQTKYLEALEVGDYGKLPPEVYVRGFLRSYAGHLGIPEEPILRLYERERSIRNNLGAAPVPASLLPGGIARPRISLSSRGLTIAAIALVTFGFFAYLYAEFSAFVSEPRLVILSPNGGDTVREAETVVRGETDPRATVRINGDEVAVDERGNFSEKLALDAGLNEIIVSSTNRFGKTRERTLTVNADIPGRDAMADVGADAAVSDSVRLTLSAVAPTYVTVRADGETVWSGELPVGEEKPFSAKERIEVGSGSGPDVLARSGSGPAEPLSEKPGPTTVSYGPDGSSQGT